MYFGAFSFTRKYYISVTGLLPEIIQTNCAKCSDVQIKKAAEVIRKLRKDFPDSYKKLSDAYDPTGEFFNKFEQLAKTKA